MCSIVMHLLKHKNLNSCSLETDCIFKIGLVFIPLGQPCHDVAATYFISRAISL